MIDLHCHLLPGIDDGPPSMAITLELARAFVAAGTTAVVATPHVSWDYSANTSTLIAGKVAEVRAALADADIPLEVHAGAEVALTRALDLPDEELNALRLAGGEWLLLECPLSPVATGVEAGVAELRRRGHDRLLLAHPERIPAFQQQPEMLTRILGAGALTSLTAGAVCGRFGREVARFSRTLLADGQAYSVASDAHSLERRPPGLAGPLEEAGLPADAVAFLTRTGPAAILAGTPPPAAPVVAAPAARRGLGARLRRR